MPWHVIQLFTFLQSEKKIVNCYNSQYTYSYEELQNNSLKSYLPKSRIFLIVQNTSVNIYSAPFILQ